MIGWADDMVCYFKKLIIEAVINEHPATCGGVNGFFVLFFFFTSPATLVCAQHFCTDSCIPCSQTGQQRKAVIYSQSLIRQSFETQIEECLFDLIAISHFLWFT